MYKIFEMIVLIEFLDNFEIMDDGKFGKKFNEIEDVV